VHALGLKTAQGLTFTESFYRDMNDQTRTCSKRFAERTDNHAILSMTQAGKYAAVLHYLKALEALGGNLYDGAKGVAENYTNGVGSLTMRFGIKWGQSFTDKVFSKSLSVIEWRFLPQGGRSQTRAVMECARAFLIRGQCGRLSQPPNASFELENKPDSYNECIGTRTRNTAQSSYCSRL
jgi:Periplasmic binding protein